MVAVHFDMVGGAVHCAHPDVLCTLINLPRSRLVFVPPTPVTPHLHDTLDNRCSMRTSSQVFQLPSDHTHCNIDVQHYPRRPRQLNACVGICPGQGTAAVLIRHVSPDHGQASQPTTSLTMCVRVIVSASPRALSQGGCDSPTHSARPSLPICCNRNILLFPQELCRSAGDTSGPGWSVDTRRTCNNPDVFPLPSLANPRTLTPHPPLLSSPPPFS